MIAIKQDRNDYYLFHFDDRRIVEQSVNFPPEIRVCLAQAFAWLDQQSHIANVRQARNDITA